MNFYKDFDFKKSEKLIRLAIKEDIGSGDVTSKYFIDEKSVSNANVLVKSDGIIAGLKIFKQVYELVNKNIKVKFLMNDGDEVKSGDIVATVKGNSRSVLSAERISLNLLQRMSGVATQVNRLTKLLNNPSIKIIDTRKTTPNLRILEKLAVRIGGGENHRMGLYDMILIKDNHIEASGGIDNILKKIKKIKKNKELQIEVEVTSLSQLELLIKKGKGLIDRVMLDNFEIHEVREAVTMNKGLFEIEISGGVNSGNIHLYSGINGINFISSGAVTHSVKSMDISLEFLS